MGRGLWKTQDGGDSWEFIGLPQSRAIGDLAVRPGNPDLVYVAALGHPFGKNPERGVYRSRDGGATWEGEPIVRSLGGSLWDSVLGLILALPATV